MACKQSKFHKKNIQNTDNRQSLKLKVNHHNFKILNCVLNLNLVKKKIHDLY